MRLTDVEWKPTMDRLCMLAGLLRDEPLDEMLETLNRTESIGPILMPTAYHRGMKNIDDQRRLLRALKEVQDAVVQLAPRPTPSQEEHDGP